MSVHHMYMYKDFWICIYLLKHVYNMYIPVCTCIRRRMYIHCIYNYIHLQFCIYMYILFCTYIMIHASVFTMYIQNCKCIDMYLACLSPSMRYTLYIYIYIYIHVCTRYVHVCVTSHMLRIPLAGRVTGTETQDSRCTA